MVFRQWAFSLGPVIAAREGHSGYKYWDEWNLGNSWGKRYLMVFTLSFHLTPLFLVKGSTFPFYGARCSQPPAFWVQYYQRFNLPFILECGRGRCLIIWVGKRDMEEGLFILLCTFTQSHFWSTPHIPRFPVLSIPQTVTVYGAIWLSSSVSLCTHLSFIALLSAEAVAPLLICISPCFIGMCDMDSVLLSRSFDLFNYHFNGVFDNMFNLPYFTRSL